ncbi:Pkinase-domain-containing protein [Sistotremastrum suecicum HHB10207 ss-3]|uniref:Pkinase-domain-containing protein n=1 Tax=Sistotremastrum suecicum HHB10207 ss-3 TaxID=1314776 RepID=A0A165YKB1_9AGAM|nr:Pkinase-domain-containing protein [Sistotremastrum suecicum HHB10207 ss-3]
MSTTHGHRHTQSQNQRATLAQAYSELGKELSSSKIRVVGNYTLGKVIGEGTYGKVRLGTHRLTSTRVAIKQIPKAVSASLTREIHHHRRLHHPHIAQLYEVIATETYVWLVTELCSGGELFDYLVEQRHLTEEDCQRIFGQLCLALAYAHGRGVVHRDLKLENVLLDQRCRVKLGDFGFTREFERGTLLDTYCGTTAYASPEMIRLQKYSGPETDVWSLGIILYTLLTGSLPFDDDDEAEMKRLILKGDYEDPDWLSEDARDLIRKILQPDPSKRLTVAQILGHAWFRNPAPTPARTRANSPIYAPVLADAPMSESGLSSAATDSTNNTAFHSALSNFSDGPESSPPTTPSEQARSLPPASNDDDDKAFDEDGIMSLRHNLSQSTIKTPNELGVLSLQTPSKPYAVIEEEVPPSGSTRRTPARTKRRSTPIDLSPPQSPTLPATSNLKVIPERPDYLILSSAPTPLVFSTPLERELLNDLAKMGFDTAQMVHSVVSDACDASSAIWWMLLAKRKADRERRLLSADSEIDDSTSVEIPVESKAKETITPPPERSTPSPPIIPSSHRTFSLTLSNSKSAPQLGIVPPTPTASERLDASHPHSERPRTPPKVKPGPIPFLHTGITTSIPGTPSTSHTSNDTTPRGESPKSGRAAKPRSGSVSMLQRATTALEAAASGLVRKKSDERVREKEKEKEQKKEKAKEKEKEKEKEAAQAEESKSSTSSSRLTKSPPPRAKDEPATPEREEPSLSTSMGSPWMVPSASTPAANQAPSPLRIGVTRSATFSTSGRKDATPTTKGEGQGNSKNRASLLLSFNFKSWFGDDRKGKRKATIPATPPSTAGDRGSVRRGRGGYGGRGSHRPKRASVSSRRSSSVNSRRSSGASLHLHRLDSPQQIISIGPTRSRSDASRQSVNNGTQTPMSDRGSRPSSIRSFSIGPVGHKRRSLSPSHSSNGSIAARAASPSQKYHRRRGSGESSTTTVIRQYVPVSRPGHGRTHSSASSIHSRASSRPTSIYGNEGSEGEVQSPDSPGGPNSSRSPTEEQTPRRLTYNSVFVAHKRQTPFTSPSTSASIGRGGSSWRKTWGAEPPGWRYRSTHSPVEILPTTADLKTSIRDVFTGRPSLSTGGDDDEWEDIDDDGPVFAGGLGQGALPASHRDSFSSTGSDTPSGTFSKQKHDLNVVLSVAKTSGRAKRTGKQSTGNNSAGLLTVNRGMDRSKGAHSPIPKALPVQENLPSTSQAVRRQLPTGTGFRERQLPIQEEEEEEEEDE